MSVFGAARQEGELGRAIARAEYYRCNQSVRGFKPAEIQELGEIRQVFGRNNLTPANALIARFVFGPLEPIPNDEQLLQDFPD
jgi:hypothetical protein